MTKFISIALACYNGEAYIRQQLDSLLRQSYHHLEIVICDDGSSDSTFEILEQYKKQDSRIRIDHNEHGGVLKNFEKALSLCRGEYIATCDQDDIWHSDKIAVMLSQMENYSLIYHDDALIDAQGKLLAPSFFDHVAIRPLKNDLRSLMVDNWISGHSMMFSAELLADILPIPPETEHYDMWIALVAAKRKGIKYLNRPLVQWRQHQDNFSGNKVEKSNFWSNALYPVNRETHKKWNGARIRRLQKLHEHELFRQDRKFIEQAINYYALTGRIKAFFFALFHIHLLILKKGILRKIRYILLPLYGPKVEI